jgi:hypothetical protein
MENDVLHEIHGLLGANFGQGFRLDPLSKFIDCDEQVGQALRRLIEGSQKVQAPHGEQPGNVDCLELLGQGVNLPSEVLAFPAGPYDLRCVGGGHRPVISLLKSLLDHAPR